MFTGNSLNKIIAVIVFIAAGVLAGQQFLGDEPSNEGQVASAEADSPTEAVRYSNLPTAAIRDLPPEASETLERIENDGPHPYRKDGSTFQNREGILPDQEIGHYQEFTVDTPGSSDRGARRIVTGKNGERFYTDDHYQSFSEIVN